MCRLDLVLGLQKSQQCASQRADGRHVWQRNSCHNLTPVNTEGTAPLHPPPVSGTPLPTAKGLRLPVRLRSGCRCRPQPGILAPWPPTILFSTHDAVIGEEEVGHGSGEVVHALASEGRHDASDGAEEPEVVVDGLEVDAEDAAFVVGLVVRLEDGQELGGLSRNDVDLVAIVHCQEVQEGVHRVAIVTAEGAQRVGAVKEDDGVAGLQEVLG